MFAYELFPWESLVNNRIQRNIHRELTTTGGKLKNCFFHNFLETGVESKSRDLVQMPQVGFQIDLLINTYFVSKFVLDNQELIFDIYISIRA